VLLLSIASLVILSLVMATPFQVPLQKLYVYPDGSIVIQGNITIDPNEFAYPTSEYVRQYVGTLKNGTVNITVNKDSFELVSQGHVGTNILNTQFGNFPLLYNEYIEIWYKRSVTDDTIHDTLKMKFYMTDNNGNTTTIELNGYADTSINTAVSKVQGEATITGTGEWWTSIKNFLDEVSMNITIVKSFIEKYTRYMVNVNKLTITDNGNNIVITATLTVLLQKLFNITSNDLKYYATPIDAHLVYKIHGWNLTYSIDEKVQQNINTYLEYLVKFLKASNMSNGGDNNNGLEKILEEISKNIEILPSTGYVKYKSTGSTLLLVYKTPRFKFKGAKNFFDTMHRLYNYLSNQYSETPVLTFKIIPVGCKLLHKLCNYNGECKWVPIQYARLIDLATTSKLYKLVPLSSTETSTSTTTTSPTPTGNKHTTSTLTSPHTTTTTSPTTGTHSGTTTSTQPSPTTSKTGSSNNVIAVAVIIGIAVAVAGIVLALKRK